MTDRKGNRRARGRSHTGPWRTGRALAVWMILLLILTAGCGAGQEPGQEQLEPERIGSVGHRDKTEEAERGELTEDEGSQEEGSGERTEDEGGQEEGSGELTEEEGDRSEPSEDGIGWEEGRGEPSDVLHVGQIVAGGEEEVAELTFRIVGEAEGISQEAADQIARINQGEQLWEVIGSDYLKDYYALTGTHTIAAQDRESGQEAVGAGRLTMYVPNLLEGLTDIAALFYDNAAKTWCLIPAEQVNIEKKTVSLVLTGSGTMTIVHKRQGETKD